MRVQKIISRVGREILNSYLEFREQKEKFEILISNSRVESEIWNSYLEFESRKRNLKFLFRVSRGEREIKSSYFSRIEIEISKKDLLVTCK